MEGFVGLIGLLRQRNECQIVLLGGPREAEFNWRLTEMAGQGIIDAGCDSSIDEFMGLVDLCGLIVTADTMAMHIAIGLRKEVVAVFGPTCDEEVDLFGRGEIIDTDFECSPCYLKTCDKNPTCMMALDPLTVAEAVGRRLEKLAKAAGTS
jgi:heptosyltransferase-2